MANPGPVLTEHESIAHVTLNAGEREVISDLLDRIAPRAGRPEPPIEEQLEHICVLSHQLPERLRTALTRFRITGRSLGGIVIGGLPVDESLVGPTPTSYNEDRPGLHESRSRRSGRIAISAIRPRNGLSMRSSRSSAPRSATSYCHLARC